jgi:ATP-dependent RNA helicase DDX3X
MSGKRDKSRKYESDDEVEPRSRKAERKQKLRSESDSDDDHHRKKYDKKERERSRERDRTDRKDRERPKDESKDDRRRKDRDDEDRDSRRKKDRDDEDRDSRRKKDRDDEDRDSRRKKDRDDEDRFERKKDRKDRDDEIYERRGEREEFVRKSRVPIPQENFEIQEGLFRRKAQVDSSRNRGTDHSPVRNTPSTPSSQWGDSATSKTGSGWDTPKPASQGASDTGNCSECDEPGHHSDTCAYKAGPSQGTHNTTFMTSYTEDDIPEGHNKESFMFAADKKREEMLFSHTLAGLDFSNYEKFKVEIEGKSVPNPLDTFQSMKWTPVIENAIALAKWKIPTPVQKYALPAVIADLDVMACAQTGSGKTACYLLPTIRWLLMTRFPPNSTIGPDMRALPRVLIMAPTRELAQQISQEVWKFTYRSPLKSCCVYGGAGYADQLDFLKRGCDILVSTPGRLMDMINKGKIELSQVKYLIIDEADRMLDEGFKADMLKIIVQCPEDKQTLMFSATFPKSIQYFAAEQLRENQVFIQVGRVGSTTDLISQYIEFVEEYNKSYRLLELLKEYPGKTLVFAQTKLQCDQLDREIRSKGVRSMSIHSGKSQQSRELALSKFRKGELRVLVATDVASRGLDVNDIAHVIIYDIPSHIDDYIHRIGRTGRAGNKGMATSFYNRKNRNLSSELKDLLLENNQDVPAFLTDDSPYATGSTYRVGSRPQGESTLSSQGKAGDWTCSKCGQSNFASRVRCFKRDCGAAREEGGSSNAFGGQSSGSWAGNSNARGGGSSWDAGTAQPASSVGFWGASAGGSSAWGNDNAGASESTGFGGGGW